MKQPADGERSRLIREIIQANQQQHADARLPLDSAAGVEGLLAAFQREQPGSSDEEVLRGVLMWLGNTDALLSPERRGLVDMIKEARELTYQRRYGKAEKVLTKAWRAAEQLDDDQSRAWVKQYQGRVKRDTGHFDAAMLLYGEARTLAIKIRDLKLVAVVYDQIGSTLRMRGELDQAEAYHHLALEADPDSASFVQGNLALIEQLRGNKAGVKKRTARSGAAYAAAGNRRGLAVVALQRAEAALLEGDFIGAGRNALEAHRLAVETGHAQVVDDVRTIIHQLIGRLMSQSDALPVFRELLELDWQTAQWPLRRDVILNEFFYCAAHGRYVDAAESAWALTRLAATHSDLDTGAVLQRHRRFRKAPLRSVQEALESAAEADPATGGAGVAAATLGLAYCQAALGQSALARQLADEAETLFTRTGDPQNAGRAVRLRADIGPET
jgi:tetratricopeptide (TPR) repeat protein